MLPDLTLRRKRTVRAHGRRLVLVKKPGESAEHVWMKAFLWALYLPAYPGLAVEVPIGDRYKPDVVDVAPDGRPRFWGEAGKVSEAKYRALLRRFPDTRFAVARWGLRVDPHVALIRGALPSAPRPAPIEVLGIPPDAPERFVAPDGTLTVTFADVTVVRVG